VANEFAKEIKRQPEEEESIHGFAGTAVLRRWASSIADVAAIVQQGWTGNAEPRCRRVCGLKTSEQEAAAIWRGP